MYAIKNENHLYFNGCDGGGVILTCTPVTTYKSRHQAEVKDEYLNSGCSSDHRYSVVDLTESKAEAHLADKLVFERRRRFSDETKLRDAEVECARLRTLIGSMAQTIDRMASGTDDLS